MGSILIVAEVQNGAVREAIAQWADEDTPVDLMRIRAYPFPDSVEAFLREHEHNYIIEQNRDGQLHRLLLLETEIERARITSVVDYGGMPLSAQAVRQGVQRQRVNGSTMEHLPRETTSTETGAKA